MTYTSLRVGLAITSMAMYLVAGVLLYPVAGLTVLALAFIPPAIAGWLLGVWGGLLSGILSFPLTYLLQHIVGGIENTKNVGAAIMGGSSVMLIGMTIGWVRGLLDRLKKQTEELEQERRLLEEEVKRRVEAEERLTHEALHDPLTDLPNRRLFISRLEHVLAWSQRNPDSLCALLYLDLNRFKSINDSLGHEAGDQLLVQVAGRLKSSLRAVDMVARMGGDEFAILLEAVSTSEEVIAIVERVQKNLAASYEWNGRSIVSGASIGAVMNITTYERIDDIMRDADVAMYRSKSDGGKQFRAFSRDSLR